MQMIADRVGVDGPHGTLVAQTSLTVASGEVALVKGEPGAGLTAFGLALAGRLRPSTGTVTVLDGADGTATPDEAAAPDEDTPDVDADDDTSEDAAPGDDADGGDHDAPVTDPAALRRLAAVVDAPGVSEPDDALPVRVVVGEELALARRPANRAAVIRWLTDHDAAAYADVRFEQLDPDLRTRLLTALAATRAGVRLLVLDRPDRHTGEVDGWTRLADEYAERGLAVVVLTATVPDSALPTEPARIGRQTQPAPTRRMPEDHS